MSEASKYVVEKDQAARQPEAAAVPNGPPGAYTAARIAAWLGISPQAMRKALRNIRPATIRIVNGTEAGAWNFDQLPESIRQRLTANPRRQQYPSTEAMLASLPSAAWEPPIPLAEIRDDCIEDAKKLRAALLPWLVQQHDLELSTAEMEAKGVADYARSFGHRVSGRYWRELFSRTLRRDNGAENWNRLEIYLPERPALKQTPALLVSAALADEFWEIQSYIEACRDPSAPTETEKQAIWTLAFEKFTALAVQDKMTRKKAARCVRNFLSVKAAFLASSRDALLKAFDRKLEKLEKLGGNPTALRDGRENNGERWQLPEDDHDLLVHRSVFYYGRRVAQAWRDCLENGFSQPVVERYAGKAACKSHVPKTVMDSVSAEVEILGAMHRGKRAFDAIKGFVSRSYEGIHSLKCMSADDFTMPVRYFVPDNKGWFDIVRGQILVFIDFRSLAVLGFSMQPTPNYDSLTIRSLCTKVFSLHGLPEVLQFERGIWKRSIILTGRDPQVPGMTEVVQGLREFGIRFIHSIRPRSKTVERVGGLLQDLMEGEPGYCGRDERRDGPEILIKQMAEVRARKAHPDKYFYSYEQWNKRFAEIVAQYNAAAQQGKILGGLSPDEALFTFADHENPPTPFDGNVRYLLAHHKFPTTVTLNGVRFRDFKYGGEEIKHLVGEQVLAWFDPENPETITLTNMNRKNPICVPRAKQPSALECLIDPGSGTLASELKRWEDQASYLKARFTAIKAKFPMPQRIKLVEANTVKLGEEIETQKSRFREEKSRVAKLGADNRDRARRMNIPPALVGDSEKARAALDMLAEARLENERNEADRMQKGEGIE